MTFALVGIPFFFTVSGSGIAQVNAIGGALTTLVLPAGAFATTAVFPGGGLVGELQVTAANGAGSFLLTAMGGGGAMPALGNLRLCLLTSCSAAPVVLSLPLSVVGAGGTAMVAGPPAITIEGAPWTKGTASIMGPGFTTIFAGTAHGPASLPGSTAQAGGILELVTPILVATSLPGLGNLDSFAILHIEFLPEPGALLPLAGALGCAVLGLSRLR
jgi:hypothetical protein